MSTWRCPNPTVVLQSGPRRLFAYHMMVAQVDRTRVPERSVSGVIESGSISNLVGAEQRRQREDYEDGGG